mgnify:CR=1 FL=1|jgi:hypothetical protein
MPVSTASGRRARSSGGWGGLAVELEEVDNLLSDFPLLFVLVVESDALRAVHRHFALLLTLSAHTHMSAAFGAHHLPGRELFRATSLSFDLLGAGIDELLDTLDGEVLLFVVGPVVLARDHARLGAAEDLADFVPLQN